MRMNKKQLVAFLAGHFRYDTMNSWNAATSYAHNVKVSRLPIPSGLMSEAYDLIGADQAPWRDEVEFVFREFAERHDWEWQIGWNGRSSGYVVLYPGARQESGYKSRCTSCGQLNYQLATEENKSCGVCRQPTRVNFTKPHTKVITYPGRGVDMGEDFESWSIDDLRRRYRLVRDFDRTVQRAIGVFITHCKEFTVEEQTIMVPKTVRVAVARS